MSNETTVKTVENSVLSDHGDYDGHEGVTLNELAVGPKTVVDTESLQPLVISEESDATTPPQPQQQQQQQQQSPSPWRLSKILLPPPCITSTCPKESSHPLTVIAKIQVLPGHEREFEKWYYEICNIQRDHWPGYLSSELVKPIAHAHDYISIFRYDNYEHLEAWMKSPERRSMLERAKEFAEAPPQLTFHSLEYLFVHPTLAATSSGGQGLVNEINSNNDGKDDPATTSGPPPSSNPPSVIRPPAKHKMALVLSLVIWGQNQWTPKVLLRIFGVGTLPKWLFQYLSTLLTVVVLTYIAMPIATGLLGFFLFPDLPYRLSFKNGFMSLPWPIPKFITWMTSKGNSKAPTELTSTTSDVETSQKHQEEDLEKHL